VPGEISTLLENYRHWLDKIDTAFNRVRMTYPEAVPCHAGCSHCCYALFAVPVIDGFLLWEGLRRENTAFTRNALDRCRSLWADFRHSYPEIPPLPFRVETVGWREFDVLVQGFARPCPFLTDTGACGIYTWRPRICRLAGTVFADPVTGSVIPDFCPLAESARKAAEFQSAPLDISAMDARMYEFREEFADAAAAVCRRSGSPVTDRARDGHTFPAAGVLEAAAFYSSAGMM